jgi:LPS O-antigen subunit length determinant protein (WzzB/FepE family)
MKEIDLIQLIKLFFKNIHIVSIVTFVIAFLFYYYQSTLPKKYYANIVIKKPSFERFSSDFIYMSKNRNEQTIILSFYEEFNDDFQIYMTSVDNFKFFLSQNDLKNLINKAKINQVKKIIQKNSNQKYSILEFKIFYDQGIDGPEILNNYTQYVRNLTIKEYKQKRLHHLERQISKYSEALEVAQEINQEYPLIKSMKRDGNSVLYEPDPLFYKGTRVLSKQLYQLKKNLEKIKNSEINYQFILDKASSGISINNNKRNYTLFGIFLGLILSLIIVLTRSKIKFFK